MDPLENLSLINKILLLIVVILFAIAVPTGAYILSKAQYANKNAATTYSPTPKPSPIASILSETEKLQIEAWITKNDLNNYGDPIDTAYPGGTPLFDEATGQRIDRYNYIDQKHPDRPWCTPRPACLDRTPKCLIAETPQMCPIRETANPTANWNTQTNKEYNFSFHYPSKFRVTEKKEIYKDVPNVIYYYYTFSTGTLIQGQLDFSGFIVTITPSKGKTISQNYSGAPSGFGDSTISVSPISDTEGADEAATLINSGNGIRVYKVGNNFFEVGTFQNNNLLPDKSDDVMKYFNQILSTFKFIQ